MTTGYEQTTGAEQTTGGPPPRTAAPSVLAVGLAVFAAIQLGLALFMAVSPHGFYTDVGPFGAFNDHYIRDVASFYGAIGVGLLLAVSRTAWRVPVLAITTVQYALHSVNHLLDIDKAHPTWAGYFDFLSLAAATVLLAWLWRAAVLEAVREGRRAAQQPKDLPPHHQHHPHDQQHEPGDA